MECPKLMIKRGYIMECVFHFVVMVHIRSYFTPMIDGDSCFSLTVFYIYYKCLWNDLSVYRYTRYLITWNSKEYHARNMLLQYQGLKFIRKLFIYLKSFYFVLLVIKIGTCDSTAKTEIMILGLTTPCELI